MRDDATMRTDEARDTYMLTKGELTWGCFKIDRCSFARNSMILHVNPTLVKQQRHHGYNCKHYVFGDAWRNGVTKVGLTCTCSRHAYQGGVNMPIFKYLDM